MVQRWQQLPLDHALSCMPRVQLLLEGLAGPAGPVPDLGPAAVMDQLTVLVYDTCEAGSTGAERAGLLTLAARLGDLRRELG